MAITRSSRRDVTHSTSGATLADVLERVLDKGLVIAGDIKIKLVDVELLTIQIRLVVASVDKAREMGLDWWTRSPELSSLAATTCPALTPPKQEATPPATQVQALTESAQTTPDQSHPSDPSASDIDEVAELRRHIELMQLRDEARQRAHREELAALRAQLTRLTELLDSPR
jgi:hypothetical protein